MNTRDVLAQIGSLTRQELYRYEAKGFIKPKTLVVGRVNRKEYTQGDADMARLIKYHHMSGWAAERTLDEAYRLAIKDLGKDAGGVMKTW